VEEAIDEEAGGCIRQQVADALWELAGRFDVGVWYEYVRVGAGVNQYDVFCGVVVNGVRLTSRTAAPSRIASGRFLRNTGGRWRR
jgi:hypothetical protein